MTTSCIVPVFMQDLYNNFTDCVDLVSSGKISSSNKALSFESSSSLRISNVSYPPLSLGIGKYCSQFPKLCLYIFNYIDQLEHLSSIKLYVHTKVAVQQYTTSSLTTGIFVKVFTRIHFSVHVTLHS